MRFLGNIIWLILGGLLTASLYFICGLFICITIIGIPFGLQLIKFAGLSLWPFGKEVIFNPASGCLSVGFNVLWVLLGWWEIALVHLVFGLILCVTVVGIPWGIQHFKLAKYSVLPFGCSIKDKI